MAGGLNKSSIPTYILVYYLACNEALYGLNASSLGLFLTTVIIGLFLGNGLTISLE